MSDTPVKAGTPIIWIDAMVINSLMLASSQFSPLSKPSSMPEHTEMYFIFYLWSQPHLCWHLAGQLHLAETIVDGLDAV